MARIDAIVMGRTTFETVCSFDIAWPYEKPVFVLSHSEVSIPDALKNKVESVSGNLSDILSDLHQRGYLQLYIDGGKTIQSFLQQDLIDELIITQLPILLGGGTPLFGTLEHPIHLQHQRTEVLLNALVQTTYTRSKAT